VRLRALEGGAVVETDADVTHDRYLGALAALEGQWRDAIVRRGGRFLRTRTSDAPIGVVPASELPAAIAKLARRPRRESRHV